MPKPLPYSRQKVLDLIAAEVSQGRSFPRAAVIRDRMGWKTTSGVSDVLTALVCEGRLRVKNRTPSGKGWRYEYELIEGETENV
jgi:hypothetical protein